MSTTPVYLQGRTATRVVLVFGLAYFLSYAMRAINAVIAPALSADLHLTNADLGLLSAAYFMGFGLMPLPIVHPRYQSLACSYRVGFGVLVGTTHETL